MDAPFVEKLLVAVQAVAVVGKQDHDGRIGEAIALQGGEDLANLLVGLHQAVVVAADLFADLGDVGIVGGHGHGRAIDRLRRRRAIPKLPELSARQLHLAEERLTWLPSPPAVAGERPRGPPGFFIDAEIVEVGPAEDKIEVILHTPVVERVHAVLAAPLRQRHHPLGQMDHADAVVLRAHRHVARAAVVMDAVGRLHRAEHHGRARRRADAG